MLPPGDRIAKPASRSALGYLPVRFLEMSL